jgi:hypothetical protein
MEFAVALTFDMYGMAGTEGRRSGAPVTVGMGRRTPDPASTSTAFAISTVDNRLSWKSSKNVLLGLQALLRTKPGLRESHHFGNALLHSGESGLPGYDLVSAAVQGRPWRCTWISRRVRLLLHTTKAFIHL